MDSIHNYSPPGEQTTDDDGSDENVLATFEADIAEALNIDGEYMFSYAIDEGKETWDDSKIQFRDIFDEAEDGICQSMQLSDLQVRGRMQDNCMTNAIKSLSKKYAQIELACWKEHQKYNP